MGWLTELRRRWQIARHKPRHWRLRPDTIDRRLFREVVVHNDYQLPSRFDPQDVILDVGAHTGSFAYAMLRRGAGTVYCCEPDPANFRLLQHNLRAWPGRVHLACCAVWRSDQAVTHLPFHRPGDPRNTGAGCVAANGLRVPALPFDDLVRRAAGPAGRIRLLKLDCEGAEWPILLTSRTLDRVDAICGEYHLPEASEPFVVAGYPEFTPRLLAGYLTAQGYAVRLPPGSPKNPRLGLFFAQR
jgi:FkbM family methyltransferase